VYELRNMVLDLENQLSGRIAALDLALDALARAEKANQDLESSARTQGCNLARADERNAELEDYISGISHASSYMLNKETRRAMFEEARKYAINMAQGNYHYNAPPSTNYALEA